MLTSPYDLNYGVLALDVSSVGISTPYPKRAKALLSRAFFVPTVIMAGCMEALRSAACSLGGSTNSVQPAAFIRLVPCLGGSHAKEDLPMCKDISTKPSDFISVSDNTLTTTSLLVAKAFGKNHYDILKKIKSLDCSSDFNDGNFTVINYKDGRGRKKTAYNMTREGFIFLVMGFTGKPAAKIKEAYIMAFKQIEDKLYGLPVLLDKPLSDYQLKKQQEQQAKDIEERLGRLMSLFDPLSRPFNDALGISRLLRGLHHLGYPMPGYTKVLGKDDSRRREDY